MRYKYTVVLAVLLLLALVFSTALAGKADPPPSLNTLEPGGFRDIEQDLAINVVFVGYEQGAGSQEIDEAAFSGRTSLDISSGKSLPFRL